MRGPRHPGHPRPEWTADSSSTAPGEIGLPSRMSAPVSEATDIVVIRALADLPIILINGRSDIFSYDLTARKLTNLTDDDAWDFGPAFSPDGKTLVTGFGNIVGTLVEIGRGRQRPAWMGDVLGARDRAFLNRVWEGPANLPDLAEIRDPQRWIDRIEGHRPEGRVS